MKPLHGTGVITAVDGAHVEMVEPSQDEHVFVMNVNRDQHLHQSRLYLTLPVQLYCPRSIDLNRECCGGDSGQWTLKPQPHDNRKGRSFINQACP